LPNGPLIRPVCPSGIDLYAIDAMNQNVSWGTGIDTSGFFSPCQSFARSTDGGANWVQHAAAFAGADGFPNVIHFFDANNGVVIGDPNPDYFEIYTTTDAGPIWTRVPRSNIPSPLSVSEFGGINSYAAIGNTIWFGTYQGRVLRSSDRGASWSAASAALGPNAIVSAIAFYDATNGIAVSAEENTGIPNSRMSRSTDSGLTWTSMTPPLRPSSEYVRAVPGTSGIYMLTASGEGLVTGSACTTNNGAGWVQIDSLRHSFSEFAGPNIGWTGGIDGAGLAYRWIGTALVSVGQSPTLIPNSFSLSQNYPNPFSPTTKIEFRIQDAGFTSLKIYDVLGHEVATLVDELKQPGAHTTTWDARNLPSGVYFCRLSVTPATSRGFGPEVRDGKAESHSETRKLILMR